MLTDSVGIPVRNIALTGSLVWILEGMNFVNFRLAAVKCARTASAICSGSVSLLLVMHMRPCWVLFGSWALTAVLWVTIERYSFKGVP